MLNTAIKAARKAGGIINKAALDPTKVQIFQKHKNDFVTNVDKECEYEIKNILFKAYPKHIILAEESTTKEELASTLCSSQGYTWIVDPIDGTTNFLHGIPHFAISIALEIDNEIKSALIHDPIKNEMFFAEKNNGAFFNNHRVRVSNKSDIEDCLFSSDQNGLKFIYPSLNMRSTGCSALDLAYVGSGRLDGFFHNKINLWDIAAGTLIITEAGGITNDFTQYDYDNINIRAASSTIYKEMTKKLANF